MRLFYDKRSRQQALKESILSFIKKEAHLHLCKRAFYYFF
jgi:hypothetical protein